ncbi:S8 family peptidase [Desertibacillus haloalkaliphilus]|uniref:S8 family peptidase n=1 Tax=Desertibacillus haloalkaliphilus TaxID=1328930 RepID=UPI001C27EC4F|nr:S8 family peptidase [Desertibacillus haloalkaliphilus]MBU8907793.1 S8 family peptidase [Desertibacillus haloalkaliphilus]
MSKLNPYAFFIGAILLFLIAAPFWGDGGNQQRATNQSQPEPLDGSVMDQVLADDLAMTTSLFITHLSEQLQEWAERDLSEPSLQKEFEDELYEHPHFHSFAVTKNDQVDVAIGQISTSRLKELIDDADQDIVYSDPYEYDGHQYFLMAQQKDTNGWVAGEVDLSFVRTFINDMASVADANGNFFISNGDPEVDIEDGKDRKHHVTAQSVPELDWQIVVASDDEETDKERDYQEHEAVVKFNDETEVKQWINAQSTITIKKDSDPYLVLRDETKSTADLIELLSADEAIEFVEPNYVISKQGTASSYRRHSSPLPNDEFFATHQWNLSQIQAEEGWDMSIGDEDVIIAILDTGVDPDHQDLKEKVLDGYNSFDGSSDYYDSHGHGTHVAGIAAAITNNINGIAGVSWNNPILPVKVLDDDGEGTSFEVARGIRWATNQGAKVINMSLGDYYDSFILHDAIRYADRNDVVLIAASGNDNVDDPMYPSEYEEVLTVAAVDHNRDRALFSNYGHHVDVTAPGEHIPSTFPNNNYVIMSGTSMAAPHVAGLAGLIRSIQPELTNSEVYQLIRETSEDLGPKGLDPYYGYGEINVAKALDRLLNE